MFSPIFSTNFSQFEQLKKKTIFHWSKSEKIACCELIKTEKNLWKQLVKQNWLFDNLTSRTGYMSLTKNQRKIIIKTINNNNLKSLTISMWSWFCWPDITTMSEKSWLCRDSVWFGLLCRTAILQSQLFLFPQATRAKLVRIRAYSFHCGITWNYWYRNQKVEKLSSNVSKIYCFYVFENLKSQLVLGIFQIRQSNFECLENSKGVAI